MESQIKAAFMEESIKVDAAAVVTRCKAVRRATAHPGRLGSHAVPSLSALSLCPLSPQGAQLCRTHGLSAGDLVAKWIAFALRNGVSDVPTLASLDSLATEIEKASKGAHKSTSAAGFSESAVYTHSSITGV